MTRRDATKVEVGDVFGMLTVTGPAVRWEDPPYKGESFFPVVCSCGKEQVRQFYGLRENSSCGHTRVRTKHGKSNTPLHKVWRSIRSRCYTESSTAYENYGGRGIVVDPRWDDFEAFESWALAAGWEKGLDVDRVDNDGPYSPENCVIATRKENLTHTRRTKYLTAWGETKALILWADDDRCAVSSRTLDSRLRRGWEHERAISTPAGPWLGQAESRG